MFEAMEFWLKRGIDGYRVDVISMLCKDLMFPDEPVNPYWTSDMPYRDKNFR